MLKDYEEFLELLNKHGIKYLIVGGFAVAYHAIARATKDIDIFHEATQEKARALSQVVREFYKGAEIQGLLEEDFAKLGQIIQLGIEPCRIDLISSLPGLAFEKAWKKRAVGSFGRVSPCYFLSLDDLIRIKREAGRDQDKVDVRILERAKARQKKRKSKR